MRLNRSAARMLRDNGRHIFDPLPVIPVEEREVKVGEIIQPNRKGIVNPNTGFLYSIASNRYKLVRHEEAIQSIEGVIQDNTGGSIDRRISVIGTGSRVEATWKFRDMKYDDGTGHMMNPLIRVLSSYDLQWALTLEFGAWMLICSNGAVVGEIFASYKRRHTEALSFKDIAQTIQNGFNRFDDVERMMVDMGKREVSIDYRTKLIESLQLGKRETQTLYDTREVRSGLTLSEIDETGTQNAMVSLLTFYNLLTQFITHSVGSRLRQMELARKVRLFNFRNV